MVLLKARKLIWKFFHIWCCTCHVHSWKRYFVCTSPTRPIKFSHIITNNNEKTSDWVTKNSGLICKKEKKEKKGLSQKWWKLKDNTWKEWGFVGFLFVYMSFEGIKRCPILSFSIKETNVCHRIHKYIMNIYNIVYIRGASYLTFTKTNT